MVEVSSSTKGQEPQLITTAHVMFPFSENTAGLRDSHAIDRAIKPSFSNGSKKRQPYSPKFHTSHYCIYKLNILTLLQETKTVSKSSLCV